ncbi:hypothetical protein KDW36_16055 [Burkholderia dolosa]|uniref:hypothetical protein n=1 Tax=Burkholderia dolosa TaxID=152500 RepID=UPI001B9C95A5|nr:hypothetical protein [Burkholderia dolosa]MBR8314699.1 hypothetical protein [Burkholderia dolosa]
MSVRSVNCSELEQFPASATDVGVSVAPKNSGELHGERHDNPCSRGSTGFDRASNHSLNPAARSFQHLVTADALRRTAEDAVVGVRLFQQAGRRLFDFHPVCAYVSLVVGFDRKCAAQANASFNCHPLVLLSHRADWLQRSRIEPANDFLDAFHIERLFRGETNESHSAVYDAARDVGHRRMQRRAHQ